MSVDLNTRKFVAGGNLTLWLCFLGAPALWLLQMQVLYMLVPYACTSGHQIVLHSVGFIFAIVVLFSALMSWKHFKAIPKAAGDEGRGFQRGRFMALLGVATGSLFTLAILVQAAATLIISPCAD